MDTYCLFVGGPAGGCSVLVNSGSNKVHIPHFGTAGPSSLVYHRREGEDVFDYVGSTPLPNWRIEMRDKIGELFELLEDASCPDCNAP